ncbi:hypothetical protein BJV82DRAFT_712407 [Fennellomyces sp. T-0311]|nr:hypothetical protein BJV82DRAFT_712407 [Fennellomyces sp. T-0311]
MQTSIAPSQILRAIQYIQIHFSRLQSLSFGTHYYILKSNGVGSKSRLETIQESGVTVADPDNHIHAAPEAWAKQKFLCLTSFKVESNVDAKLLGMAAFRSMPNLVRFSCRGNLFSMNTEEEIFVTLVRQCPRLDFINIEQNRNPCIIAEMATNIFTQQRRHSLREFRIVGHGGCKRTDRYIKAILKLTKDSLCCAQINSPDCEYLFFMAGWEFPLLKYFISRCNYREAGNIPICIGHPDLCGVHLLKRFKYLHEVELRFMQVNMSALKQLEELKYLTLMVLDNCFGVPSEDELYRIRYRVWIKKY